MDSQGAAPNLTRPQTSIEKLRQLLGADAYLLQYLPIDASYTLAHSDILRGHLPYKIALGTAPEAHNLKVDVFAYMSTTYRQGSFPEIHYYGIHPPGTRKQYRLENVVVDGDLRDEFQPAKDMGAAVLASLIQLISFTCLFIVKGADIPPGSVMTSRFFADVRAACYRYRNFTLSQKKAVSEEAVKRNAPDVVNCQVGSAPLLPLWSAQVPKNVKDGQVGTTKSIVANKQKNRKRKQPSSGPSNPSDLPYEDLQVTDLSATSPAFMSTVTLRSRHVGASTVATSSSTTLPQGLETWATLVHDLEDTKAALIATNKKLESFPAKRDEQLNAISISIDADLRHTTETNTLQKKHEWEKIQLKRKQDAEVNQMSENHKVEAESAKQGYADKKAEYAQILKNLEEEQKAMLHAKTAIEAKLEAEKARIPREQLFSALEGLIAAQRQNKRLKLDDDQAAHKEEEK